MTLEITHAQVTLHTQPHLTLRKLINAAQQLNFRQPAKTTTSAKTPQRQSANTVFAQFHQPVAHQAAELLFQGTAQATARRKRRQ